MKKGAGAYPTSGRAGQRKAAIVTLLKGAGPQGISLKQICHRLALSSNQLNTWLYSTGKKIKGIKKLDRGVYGWRG